MPLNLNGELLEFKCSSTSVSPKGIALAPAGSFAKLPGGQFFKALPYVLGYYPATVCNITAAPQMVRVEIIDIKQRRVVVLVNNLNSV